MEASKANSTSVLTAKVSGAVCWGATMTTRGCRVTTRAGTFTTRGRGRGG